MAAARVHGKHAVGHSWGRRPSTSAGAAADAAASAAAAAGPLSSCCCSSKTAASSAAKSFSQLERETERGHEGARQISPCDGVLKRRSGRGHFLRRAAR